MDAAVNDHLFLYPSTDADFAQDVRVSLAPLVGRPVEDPGILAAAAALLRSNHPLAIIQARPERSPGGATEWEVFRDDTVLDHELIRRVQDGEPAATDQLFARYRRLAYAMALGAAGEPEIAMEAVAAAFRMVVAEGPSEDRLRVRLAAAARDEARRSRPSSERVGDDPDGLLERQRAIIELAHAHHFDTTEIAAVLGIDSREVRQLADELTGYVTTSQKILAR